jgi:hypothetical protein
VIRKYYIKTGHIRITGNFFYVTLGSTKCMSIPFEQNEEQNREIKAGNKPLENVASYRYMGKL